MLYIILTTLLLIPAVVIAGLIYAYRKLPRTYFLLFVFTLITIPLAIFKIHERNFILSFIPDALHVNSISYIEEESWGIGLPGDNEAGIRVYTLPEKIADEISIRGIEFFKNLPPNENQKNRQWRGSYGEWLETPIKPSERWERNSVQIAHFVRWDGPKPAP